MSKNDDNSPTARRSYPAAGMRFKSFPAESINDCRNSIAHIYSQIMEQMEDLYPPKYQHGDLKSLPSHDFVSDMIANNRPFDVDNFLLSHTKKFSIPDVANAIHMDDKSDEDGGSSSTLLSSPTPSKKESGENMGRLRWTEIRRIKRLHAKASKDEAKPAASENEDKPDLSEEAAAKRFTASIAHLPADEQDRVQRDWLADRLAKHLAHNDIEASRANLRSGDLALANQIQERHIGSKRALANHLLGCSQLDAAEILKISEKFKSHSKKGVVNYQGFKRVMGSVMKRATAPNILKGMFDAFDADGSGNIDFQEFVESLQLLRSGSLAHRVRFIFNLYDTDRDGWVSIVELTSILSAKNDGLVEMAHYAEKVFNSMDGDGDGTVTMEEFVEAVEEDPLLLDAMTRCFPSTRHLNFTQRESVRALCVKVGLDWEILSSIWCTLREEAISHSSSSSSDGDEDEDDSTTNNTSYYDRGGRGGGGGGG